jgi:hypothetical protein
VEFVRLFASRKVGLEINVEKTRYIFCLDTTMQVEIVI